MSVIKLMVLVVLMVEVTLGSNVEELPIPSTSTAANATDNILQRPQEIRLAFIAMNDVKPSYQYRFGYEMQDPNTGITTRQYEIRYHEVNLGIYTRLGANGDGRSTVNYTIDATNGYRATLSADSPEDATLDYTHTSSPLVSATPPNDGKDTFKSFPIDDQENIFKHSLLAETAYKARNHFRDYFNIVPTHQYSWGFEFEGISSQQETYRITNGDGRITLVNAEGCVSSMDYSLDGNNFNVSTIRTFEKKDIPQLYLNPQYYPLLLQVALGSSKCDV